MTPALHRENVRLYRRWVLVDLGVPSWSSQNDYASENLRPVPRKALRGSSRNCNEQGYADADT
eukprot:1072516-Prorocentrum_minimum.AAC.2